MIKEAKIRKPKAGLLLVASPRFKNLSGPKRGTYGEKKEAVSRQIVESLNFIDIEYPGIVYVLTLYIVMIVILSVIAVAAGRKTSINSSDEV